MGKWDQAARVAARGAVAILDGKRDEGSWLMRDALRQMRELEDLLTSGLMAMAMVRLFEPGAADARAAAEQSIADFERMGSPALVKLVSDMLASAPSAPASAPSQKVDDDGAGPSLTLGQAAALAAWARSRTTAGILRVVFFSYSQKPGIIVACWA